MNLNRILHKFLRSLKYWWQRRTRGWDDTDLWSLDYTIAKYILPRLRMFIDVKIGVPCTLGGFDLDDSVGYKNAEVEWNRIITKMIVAFELIIRDGNGEFLSNEEYKLIDEGLNLFAKYLRNLWW